MLTQRHLTTLYRPQRFSEVVGQELVCKILSRSASMNKIAPGYIFSGIRGVGKTTIARIFAKTINCEKAPTPEPCNKCKFCKQITKGNCVDVMEIDGASHTGVDNIRRLNEEVGYLPVEGRYKVIIIDEAHMLSKSAFNALLKTLEEPPKYVTFIFATTEPHKFPSTIISRCQHFVFKRIPKTKIVDHLRSILDRENINYSSRALDLIARKGEGSLRDSLSMLSQVLALVDEITEESVKEILGIAGREKIYNMFYAIRDQDVERLIREVEGLMESGLDISFFLQEFSCLWRDLFVVKTAKRDIIHILNVPEDEVEILKELASSFTISFIHSAWQMVLARQRDLLLSSDPAISLQVLLLNIAFLPDLLPVESIESKDLSYKDIAGGDFKQDSWSSDHSKQKYKPRKDWKGFLKFIKNNTNISNLHLVRAEISNDKVVLKCPGLLADRLQENDRFKELKKAIEEYFEKPLDLEIVKLKTNGIIDREKLKEEMARHPTVKNFIYEFNAEIVDVIQIGEEDKL